MRNAMLLAAVAMAVAACQSVPQGLHRVPRRDRSGDGREHLADKIGTCWFDGKHSDVRELFLCARTHFASSRILIVPKGKPHDLPALVVEVLKAKRGTDVRLFGPLMQTENANSIRTDVMRWTGGARDCG